MANTANANTARLDRWGRPDWAGPHHDNFESRDDWRPRFHPGRIILIVAGFIIWWPLGLAALAYTLWSRNMGCWSQDRHGRWADKMERMQYKMERMHSRMEGRGYYAPSSGTAPSMITAWRRCAVSRKSRPNSRTSSIVCATPRTRKSSTPSWRSTSSARLRRTISRRDKTSLRLPDWLTKPPTCRSGGLFCFACQFDNAFLMARSTGE